MKILPIHYTKNKFENHQVIRSDRAAIYSRWRNDVLVGYEVFQIKISENFQLHGVEIEGGEGLPSDESFGRSAWSCASIPDPLQALNKAFQKYLKLNNMKTLDTKNEIVVRDAVRLSKSDFTELYSRSGYDKRHVSLAWHSIRVTPRGRKMMEEIFKGAPHMIETNQPATFISDMDEEVKERAEELAQVSLDQGSDETEHEASEEPKKEKKERKPRENTKADQAKALILGGETNPDVLIEKVGLSKVYAQTLIKKFKA